MYNELRKPKVIDSGGQNKLYHLNLVPIEGIHIQFLCDLLSGMALPILFGMD